MKKKLLYIVIIWILIGIVVTIRIANQHKMREAEKQMEKFEVFIREVSHSYRYIIEDEAKYLINKDNVLVLKVSDEFVQLSVERKYSDLRRIYTYTLEIDASGGFFNPRRSLDIDRIEVLSSKGVYSFQNQSLTTPSGYDYSSEVFKKIYKKYGTDRKLGGGLGLIPFEVLKIWGTPENREKFVDPSSSEEMERWIYDNGVVITFNSRGLTSGIYYKE